MFSFLPHPNETTGNWVNSIIEDYGTSGTKPIFLIQHLFSPFQNPIGCSFQCPPPALVLGHSAICMLVLSEEPLWAADFSFHSPVPKCMPLQMRGLNWDRVLKAREQTGLVHLVSLTLGSLTWGSGGFPTLQEHDWEDTLNMKFSMTSPPGDSQGQGMLM